MRKEIILAIIAGAVFGLFVTFAIWRTNSKLKEQNAAKTEAPQNSSIQTEPPISSGITIAKPNNNQVFTEDTTEISGLTEPNRDVLITSNDYDFYTKSDQTGAFKKEVKLSPGANQIVITSFGESVSQAKIVLVYSSEFSEFLKTNEPEQQESTSSGDEIRDKVQEKLAQLSYPLSYIGTITDISENSIQIKKYVFNGSSGGTSAEIQLITTTEVTTYADIKKESKKINSNDIAIGDFIIALGYIDSKDVLDAKRILVIESLNGFEYNTYLLTVTGIERNSISAKNKEGEELNVISSRNTDFIDTTDNSSFSVSQLEENSKIYAIATTNQEGNLDARTIFYIPETETQDNSSE